MDGYQATFRGLLTLGLSSSTDTPLDYKTKDRVREAKGKLKIRADILEAGPTGLLKHSSQGLNKSTTPVPTQATLNVAMAAGPSFLRSKKVSPDGTSDASAQDNSECVVM